MNNNITNLEIRNFKSIKDIKLDCKRINVFIGEPNVGKSNILEALSLFITPLCSTNQFVLKDYIRYEKLSNLIYDQDRKNIISVITNIGYAKLRCHLDLINTYDITIGSEDQIFEIVEKGGSINESQSNFDSYIRQNPAVEIEPKGVKPYYGVIEDMVNFHPTILNYTTPIKKYTFKPLSRHENPFSAFLNPPHGDNLYTIMESNPKLYETAAQFFINFRLDLLIDPEANKLDIQKRIGNRVYKIPYSLAADTLQRIIFHLAAVETNNDSILLFEEPEAHSFPPYISLLAEKIIETENNQFFITTHSPYILTPFIEQCSRNDIAIFICTYENWETKVKELSQDDISEIMDNGIDFFYNIRLFQK